MDKKWGVIAVCAVLVGLICSPLYSIWSVTRGIANHDARQVASYVDFPSLRSSLKTRLTASAFRDVAESGRGSTGAVLGGALGLMLVDGVIDRVVTPEGLVALFGRAGVPNGRSYDFRKVFSLLRMNGLTEIDLAAPDDPTTYLAFRTANFLTWKLADFVTPESPSRGRAGSVSASAAR